MLSFIFFDIICLHHHFCFPLYVLFSCHLKRSQSRMYKTCVWEGILDLIYELFSARAPKSEFPTHRRADRISPHSLCWKWEKWLCHSKWITQTFRVWSPNWPFTRRLSKWITENFPNIKGHWISSTLVGSPSVLWVGRFPFSCFLITQPQLSQSFSGHD